MEDGTLPISQAVKRKSMGGKNIRLALFLYYEVKEI